MWLLHDSEWIDFIKLTLVKSELNVKCLYTLVEEIRMSNLQSIQWKEKKITVKLTLNWSKSLTCNATWILLSCTLFHTTIQEKIDKSTKKPVIL